MGIAWRTLWRERRGNVKLALLTLALAAAVYYGSIEPSTHFRGVAEQKATGLAAIEQSRRLQWLPSHQLLEFSGEGVVGGIPGATGMPQKRSEAAPRGVPPDDQRKIVRTSSISAVVDKPAEAAAKIQELAESAGGFLVNWQANGSAEATNTSLTVRVPVSQFEFTRASILKLAQHVESVRVQADDVTRHYFDAEARLRNLRAQEAQYLAILKLAHTVKETLQVSEKLNEVRSEIEQQQSDFTSLSKQVDLVAIDVSLRKETEAQLFGLPWRPSYELRLAMREGLEGLADYTTSMMGFVFYLPAIVLWMATILTTGVAAWRIVRWLARILFHVPKPLVQPNVA